MPHIHWPHIEFPRKHDSINIDEEVNQAVTTGSIEALQNLVNKYGPSSIKLDKNPHELMSLHLAAAAGQIEIVRFLLSPPISVNPNAVCMNHFTALHSAAMNGHADVCDILLRSGAEVNIQTVPQGYTPLHSAAFAGHMDAIRVLLKHGADKRIQNYRNERPADTAMRQGQAAAAKLIDYGELNH